jgi:intracellular multiplication protein IcmT
MTVRRSIWRDASLTPRIMGIDARGYFPILIALYYPRVWTFGVALIGIGAFFFMEKKGYTLPVLLRAVRHRLRGTVIHGRAWWHHRRFHD